MDNRYLFRGYTIDGVRPHFVTGHYVSVPRPMIVSDKPKIGGGWDFDDVDPATIGQCTGLRAAKSYRGESEADRLIFEGDVDKYGGVFAWHKGCLGKWYNNKFLTMSELEISRIEIIGTIHERTEGEG